MSLSARKLVTRHTPRSQVDRRWAMKRHQPNSTIDSCWEEQARKVRIGPVRGHDWYGCSAAMHSGNAFREANNAGRNRKVKTQLCLVCGALAGITMLHCGAVAEPAKPTSTTAAPGSSSAPLKTNGESSKTVVEDC